MLWPTISNEGDFDYITEQGFWICFVVATLTFGLSVFSGSLLVGIFDGLFFFLAGVGVRQRSRIASITAFSAYLLSALVMQRYTGNGFGVVRIIFLALLLANIRGNLLSARWEREPENKLPGTRLNHTLGDKLADQLPALLWPKTKFVFFVLAFIEILLLLIALLAPRIG